MAGTFVRKKILLAGTCIERGIGLRATADILDVALSTAQIYRWAARHPEAYAAWCERQAAMRKARTEARAVCGNFCPPKRSLAQREELRVMIEEEGLSFAQAAARWGVTRSTIAGLVDRNGFVTKRKYRTDTLERVREGMAAGMKCREIVRTYSLSVNTVNFYLWRLRHPEKWDQYQSRKLRKGRDVDKLAPVA